MTDPQPSPPPGAARAPRVVLVHGAGGTPATWSAVVPLLRERGVEPVVPVLPMASLDGDVAHVLAVLDALDDDVLLVAHSYGGAVITGAGRHPRARGLVYVAAFAPDEGESVSEIVERYEPAPVSAHMRRGPDGEWSSERTEAYWAEIGGDLTAQQREVAASEDRRVEDAVFSRATGHPAWRDLPSWYLVAADDATLLPQAQRDMAARCGASTSSVPGSHFTPLVSAAVVVDLVERARAVVGGRVVRGTP